MSEIALHVGGKKYLGWETASVSLGVESIAGTFSLSLFDRWAAQQKPWPIHDGDECQVSVNGEIVITGYVDVRAASFDARSDEFTVSGRDRTGDLVDCSAKLEKWEFKDIGLKAFAEKLCAPFGIKVSLQSGLQLSTPPAKYVISPGDTVFHALEQACRSAGVLPISDGNGGLLLTRAGTEHVSVSLTEGKNILAGTSRFDSSGRFRTYHVLGSRHGNDEFFGEDASAVEGTAEDSGVTRAARVLVVRPEHGVTKEYAKKRAQWEATTRAARGDSVTVTVQGWKYDAKHLWRRNTLVSVRSPKIAVDGTLLITGVGYDLDDSGTRTRLTLAAPDAFKPEPVVPKSRGLWKEISKGV